MITGRLLTLPDIRIIPYVCTPVKSLDNKEHISVERLKLPFCWCLFSHLLYAYPAFNNLWDNQCSDYWGQITVLSRHLPLCLSVALPLCAAKPDGLRPTFCRWASCHVNACALAGDKKINVELQIQSNITHWILIEQHSWWVFSCFWWDIVF